MKAKVIAIVQYGIVGYVLADNVRFTGDSVDDVIEKINKKTATLARQIAAAQERDGDLRQYAPMFANGYPTIGDHEMEFGEDFSGCLLELTIGSVELEYMSNGHIRLRVATGLH